MVKMGRIGIYKDMVVSYQEFETALFRLGYHKVLKPRARLYINEAYDSIISISNRNTLDKMMIVGEFSAQAYLMEMKGVLESMDDIAKMIEQDRLLVSIHGQNMPQSIAA
jgi:hypothetical protein